RAIVFGVLRALSYQNSSGHARGVLTGLGNLLHYFGCLLRRRSICDVSLRNNATATSTLIYNWHAADLVFFQNSAALLDARLGCDRHWRARHGIAHPCLLRAFACGHNAARDVAVGDHSDDFHVVVAFDYGNLAAVVLYHHLGCLLHIMLRRTASGIGAHNIFGLFHGVCSFGLRLSLIEVRISSVSGA